MCLLLFVRSVARVCPLVMAHGVSLQACLAGASYPACLSACSTRLGCWLVRTDWLTVVVTCIVHECRTWSSVRGRQQLLPTAGMLPSCVPWCGQAGSQHWKNYLLMCCGKLWCCWSRPAR